MTTPTRHCLIVLVPWCVIAALASSARAVQLSDPAGDTTLRRTDQGNDGPIPPTAVLPDLIELATLGWTMTTPGGDPFVGSAVYAPAQLMRIDAQFAGLLNPPGPLGLNGQPFDPYRYGPSPLYGFIEFDIDSDSDTGGQLPNPARVRVLGNLGRFATKPIGILAERTPESGALVDRDFDFFTPPYFERSGEDFALAWCGCHATTILSGDDGDGRFEPGETWKIRGRYFPRAAGYAGASAAFGASAVGMYDPWVTLRWSYSAASNRTTVTLVYPLTPAGAAMLTGQALQPVDLDVSNHFSMQEALQDIIDGVNGVYGGGLSATTITLAGRWAKKSATDYRIPEYYSAIAIVGTSYSDSSAGLYAWTDVAFGMPHGDVNGDGITNLNDADKVAHYISVTDGTAADSDGVVNGQVRVPDMGLSFSIFDVVYDGLVNAADIDFYPTFCAADWDANGVVNSTDVSHYLNDWFFDVVSGGTSTDYDDNGVVNSTDVSTYVNTWFSDVLGCSP